jgi:tetratricopeptide (TPR) repeat protein
MRQINTKFFLILAGIGVLLTAAVVGVHWLQAGSIAGALRFQADQAEKAGKPDQAVRFLAQYLEFARDDLDQRARLALLLSDAKLATTPKARRRARFVIEQVLARDPERHDLRETFCRLALEDRLIDPAKEHLSYLEKARPQSADVAVLQGQAHELQNQPQPAVECYRRAVKASPDRALAYLKLAALLRQLDFGKDARHADEIRKLVDTALEKAPTDAAVLSAAAQSAQERGDHDAARGYLETGLKQHPTDHRLYQAIARVHTLAGKRTDAIAALRQGLQKAAKENHFELNWTLTNLLLDDNQLDEARKIIAQVREVNPVSAEYLDARCRMQQGRYFEAARTFEKVRPAFKTSRELAFQVDLYLGLTYQKLEEWTQALTAFRRAVDADPTSLLARHGMASAHWALGNTAEALAQYRELVAGNTNRAEAARWRVEYARMLLQSAPGRGKRDLARVEHELDEAEKDLRDSVDAALLRAELAYLHGKPDLAEAVLRKATEAGKDRHEPWISLASMAMGKGDVAKAEQVLKDAAAKLGDTAEFRAARAHFWVEFQRDRAGGVLARLEEGMDKFAAKDQARLLETFADAQLNLQKPAESARLLK